MDDVKLIEQDEPLTAAEEKWLHNRRNCHRRRRRYHFYFVAGMPAEICGGGSGLSLDEVLTQVKEEWPGMKAAIERWGQGEWMRRGEVFAGNRCLIVCVK